MINLWILYVDKFYGFICLNKNYDILEKSLYNINS
jgi:hypothetical protein